MTLLGVDGCRGGWLAAVADRSGAVGWRWVPAFRDLYADPAAQVLAVDIPIGLPEQGTRACDVAARRMLGRRGASVFAAPVRPVLGCTTYAEARAVLARRNGPSMSAQAFGIVRAVRDVDACVQPSDDDRVVETHPEVAFARLSDGGVTAGKKTADGQAQRTAALATAGFDIERLLATVPAPGRPDDALDALVCLWAARRWARGERATLGDGARDARGLPMRIAC